ncbi:MAG: hypothetical protein R3E67_05410 [Pseudomonadales bacterium]
MAAAPEEWRRGGKNGAIAEAAEAVARACCFPAWGVGTLQDAWQWRTAQQSANTVLSSRFRPVSS